MGKLFKEKYKTIITDVLFIAIGTACLMFRNKLLNAPLMLTKPFSMAVVAMLAMIYLFPLGIHENKKVYENKLALISAFIIIAIGQINIYIMNHFFGINNSGIGAFSTNFILFLQLSITLTLFISYFFKVRFTKFNWNISIKSFLLVIIVYTLYRVVGNGNVFPRIKIDLDFLITFFKKSLYPGIYEEVLFRGLLISGLKGCGFSDDKCNVIQAVVFGLTHTGSWGDYSWISLFSTALQAMDGYVFGKIYFKTKSLTPGILLHGLFDTINLSF